MYLSYIFQRRAWLNESYRTFECRKFYPHKKKSFFTFPYTLGSVCVCTACNRFSVTGA